MLKNSLYNLLGGVVRLGLGVLSVPLLLNWLGAESYGQYSILLSIINFSLIAESVLPIVFTVFLARCRNSEPNYKDSNTIDVLRVMFWLVIAAGLIMSFFLWLLAPSLSHFFDRISINDQRALQQNIRLSSLLVFSRLIQQYFIGLEQANGYFKLYNIINSFFGLFQTIFTLIIAFEQGSIRVIIVVQIILALIFTAIHMYVCRKNYLISQFSIMGAINTSLLKEMSLYSTRTGIGLLGSLLFSQGDRIIVAKLLGFEIVGVYSAVTAVVNQINGLSGIPIQPIVTEISTVLAVGKANTVGLYNIIKKSLILNALIAVSVGGGILLLVPELVEYLFGAILRKVDHNLIGVRSVTIIYTLYSLNAVGFYILFAVHKEIYNSIFTILGGVLVLVLIIILCPYLGLLGAFLGNSGYLITIYLLFKSFNELKFPLKYFVITLWKPLLAFILVAIVSFFCQIIVLRWLAFVGLQTLVVLWILNVSGYGIKNLKFIKI